MLKRDHLLVVGAVALEALWLIVALRYGLIGFGAGLAVVAVVALIGLAGIRSAALCFAFLGAFFIPLISIRVAPSVTVGDAFLTAAILLLAADKLFAADKKRADVRMPDSWKAVAAVVGLMGLGGSIAGVVTGTSGASGSLLLYLLAGIMGLLIPWLAQPSSRELRFLLYGFACGVALSCLVAFATPVPNEWVRPQGLTSQPNHLGVTGVLASGMWLALMATASRRLERVATRAGLLICLAGVYWSGSRAAFVGVAFVVLLAVIASRSVAVIAAATLAGVSAAMALMVGVIVVGPDTALGRLLGQGTAAVADTQRDEKYAMAWEWINQSPFLGYGFADLRLGHSLYLQMWAGAGLLGLVAALLLVVTAIGSWIAGFRRSDRLSVMLWSGYLGYLAAAVLSNQMWDRYIWVALALALAADRLRDVGVRVAARLRQRGRTGRRAGVRQSGVRLVPSGEHRPQAGGVGVR